MVGLRSAVPVARIEKSILLIRGQKVMMDKDLADLCGLEPRVLVQPVNRNLDRFPNDFAFRLTGKEFEALRSQPVILKKGRGQHRKYLPYVFSEPGVAMLSSVLRSERAIQVNVEIMRVFVRLRRLLASHEQSARKLAALERKYDSQFKVVFDAIRELMTPSEPKRKAIGFEWRT